MRLRPHAWLLGLCLVAACGDDTSTQPDGGAPANRHDAHVEGPKDAAPPILIPDASADDDGGWEVTVPDAGGGEPGVEPSDEPDGLEGLVRVQIEFDARIGDETIGCDRVLGAVGQPPSAVEFRDARFFVYDVMLIRDDGLGQTATLARDGDFHNGEVVLLDFENGEGRCESGDAAENHVVRAGVEPGTYVGVAFRIGVPEDLNHADPTVADPPLDRMGMHWGWADGYKFLRFDARTEAAASFSFHLGSTQCDFDEATGQPVCARENRPQIVLPDFDPGRQRIVLDYAALVDGMSLEDDVPGCIAGGTPDQCVPLMAKLGVDQATGEADPDAQSVFVVEDL